jgi:two-component system response regulator AlgR
MMKVLVVDDEAPARERLRSMLKAFENCDVCGEAANGEEALSVASEQHPDVMLMDIRMPGMDGMEAARHLLALEQPPAIIFTTAYSDYALAAFETHAVDYLVKPVRRERLLEALENARRLTRAQASALQQAGPPGNSRNRLCVRQQGNLELIPVDEIRYFQADQKYVTVRTAGTSVLTEETLKSLEEEFTGQFIRIHRNALVAVQYLSGLEKSHNGQFCVQLQGVDERLEISRRHIAGVRQVIKSLQG